MSAVPTTPAAPPKLPVPVKVVMTVTWPRTEEAAVLAKISADEKKASDLIEAAKKFGAVTGFAIIAKKPFNF